MISIIFILLSIIQVLNAQNLNNFCDNDRVDIAFNRGYNITVGSHDSLWFFDETKQRMTEPALPKSFLTGNDDVKILSALFIARTPPECRSQASKELDKVCKALDLLFYKGFDKRDNKEFTSVVQITAQNKAKPVLLSDYPWNLRSDLNMWPKEWNSDSSKSRPSAFNHNNLDAIFIANSGDPEKSMILWSSVSTNTWMNSMKSVKIHSNIHFVGMFFLMTRRMVYTIGDTPGDPVSRVYAIELDNNFTYFIRDIERTAKEFFGCGKQINTQSEPQSDKLYSTEPPIESVNTNPSGGHTDIIIIVVIIVILMVFGFIALIATLVLFRIQGSKQQSSVTNSNTNAFQNSSAMTASVVTVNSQTGRTNKSMSKLFNR